MPARAFLIALMWLCFAPVSAAASVAGWQWPLRGEVITAFHNGADPYAAGQHRGVDIAGPEGSAVVAAIGGAVRFAGPLGSSGVTVSVRSADGRFGTSYLHLASVSVRKGATVAAGDRLGAVGTTGTRSTAVSHLHFGVREAGDKHAYRDPLDFLPPLAPAPREAPRGAPAPVPAPAPVALAPQPVRSPGRFRVPAARRIGAPQRFRVPAGRRVRMPNLGRAPRALPRPVAVPVRPLVPTRSLRPATRLKPRAHAFQPARAPQPGPARERLPVARPSHAPAGNPAPGHTTQSGGGGPDIGLALACLGLLLAAACIGRPGSRGEGRSGQRSRGQLTAWLGPLLGRR